MAIAVEDFDVVEAASVEGSFYSGSNNDSEQGREFVSKRLYITLGMKCRSEDDGRVAEETRRTGYDSL
jgi:hypothetical protein